MILKLALAHAVRLYASMPVLAEYEDLLLRKSYLWIEDGPKCYLGTGNTNHFPETWKYT